LGIFASDAILNDMTLLGVGSGAGTLAGNTTTLGRIGTGFMYADWKSQIAFTTPNWNGFQATVGITQAFNAIDTLGVTQTSGYTYLGSATSSSRGGSTPAFEAKASYSWAGDVSGKVWVSGISQKVSNLSAKGYVYSADATYDDTAESLGSSRATAYDFGANVNMGALSLTGYVYSGRGIGKTIQLADGFDQSGKRRKSNGGYIQAMYTLPTATKLGMSWGRSTLKANSEDSEYNNVDGYGLGRDAKDTMVTVGVYHPLTKNLNLVAEYSDAKSKTDNTYEDGLNGSSYTARAKSLSLGAILFF